MRTFFVTTTVGVFMIPAATREAALAAPQLRGRIVYSVTDEASCGACKAGIPRRSM